MEPELSTKTEVFHYLVFKTLSRRCLNLWHKIQGHTIIDHKTGIGSVSTLKSGGGR